MGWFFELFLKPETVEKLATPLGIKIACIAGFILLAAPLLKGTNTTRDRIALLILVIAFFIVISLPAPTEKEYDPASATSVSPARVPVSAPVSSGPLNPCRAELGGDRPFKCLLKDKS